MNTRNTIGDCTDSASKIIWAVVKNSVTLLTYLASMVKISKPSERHHRNFSCTILLYSFIARARTPLLCVNMVFATKENCQLILFGVKRRTRSSIVRTKVCF